MRNPTNYRGTEMAEPTKVRFEIVGSQQLAEKLQRLANASDGKLSILSSSKDADAARLGLDFGVIYHVVIAVGEAFAFGHLALELCTYLLESKDPEIVIETPKGVVRIKHAPDLTKEKVEGMIRDILDRDLA
jgi:hypothetical protein